MVFQPEPNGFRVADILPDTPASRVDIRQGDLITHEETTWTSITFAGTRHEVTLEFTGEVAVEVGEEFIIALPEHEFTIPGQLVADATIKEVDHTFGAQERLVVTAVLLLLEES